MTVLDFLRTQFKTENRTHHTIITILNKFNEDGRSQLNELFRDGLIKKINGANLVIVEYLPEKDTEHDTD